MESYFAALQGKNINNKDTSVFSGAQLCVTTLSV
jgi:hypothetical protein